MPVEARRSEPTALGHYVRARASEGMPGLAAKGYAIAFAADPANRTIAYRAYREGIDDGDFALALRAARALEAGGIAPPDALLLFYIAAVRERDWKEAARRLPAVAAEPGFAFVAPVLQAWLALATGEGDALAVLDAGARRAPSAYATDARALLLAASGRLDDAVTAGRLRHLTDSERAFALTMAIDATAAGKAGGVKTPADAAAWVLAAMADDLMRERPSRAPLALARLAQFARDDAPRRLVVARALGRIMQNERALTALGKDMGNQADLLRVTLLEALGRRDEALARAQKLSATSDEARAAHADMLVRTGKASLAAPIYGQLIDATETAPDWTLLVAAGGAYERAGDWARAKPLLERALVAAPAEPDVLNHLGYALLVRGETPDRAIALISKAGALRPDDAAIIDSLGWAQMKRGAYALAVPLLERAVALDSLQPEIGEHLGDAYWLDGRRVEARYAWAAARVQADAATVERLDAKISGRARP